MRIAFEIIQILFVFAVVSSIWVLKGGSIKGFMKFIVIFILAGLIFMIGLDYFNRWQNSRNAADIAQKQDIKQSNEI